MAGVIGLMFVVQMSPGTLPDEFGHHDTQYGQQAANQSTAQV